MTARIKKGSSFIKRGFTLIELLIVIAIIGVLAVVVLVAINPVEQLAKTRDAGRISSVTQLGHAIEAYYTSRNAIFPGDTVEADWDTDLTTSGELSTFPASIDYSAYGVVACPAGDNMTNGYCYDLDSVNGAIVYAAMESNSQNSRCTSPEVAYVVFSTADGRGGVVCGAATGLDPWVAGGGPAYF